MPTESLGEAGIERLMKNRLRADERLQVATTGLVPGGNLSWALPTTRWLIEHSSHLEQKIPDCPRLLNKRHT